MEQLNSDQGQALNRGPVRRVDVEHDGVQCLDTLVNPVDQSPVSQLIDGIKNTVTHETSDGAALTCNMPRCSRTCVVKLDGDGAPERVLDKTGNCFNTFVQYLGGVAASFQR